MGRRPTEDDIRRIYRDTIDGLYGFVSRRCNGDRELAEDVTQDTWLRAVRAWRSDGVPDKPLAWLSTVAARILSNHHRRPATERMEDGSGDTLRAPEDASHLEAERQSLVHRAMARLPAVQARLLESFHFERRPVADIAAAHGLSERSVEGRLRRARQKLREQIERDPNREDVI